MVYGSLSFSSLEFPLRSEQLPLLVEATIIKLCGKTNIQTKDNDLEEELLGKRRVSARKHKDDREQGRVKIQSVCAWNCQRVIVSHQQEGVK